MMTKKEVDKTNKKYGLNFTYDDYNFDLEKAKEKKRKEWQKKENKDALAWWGMMVGAAVLMQLIFG